MPSHGLLVGQTQQQYYNSGNYGGYQFISLTDVIANFIATYTGEGKLLENTNIADVSFHAHRALAELTFDTFKSCKSQEITLPASLTMILPQDYVNYTKISWSDSSGVKHRLYPTLCNTSNPTNPYQNSDGDFSITANGTVTNGSDQLVLDDQYDNVLVGMVINWGGGAYAGVNGNIVTATSTSGGVTTITMNNNATATYTGVMPIQFESNVSSLIQEPVSQTLVTGLTIDPGVNYIIQTPVVAGTVLPEVGMHVSSEHFPAGTTVVGVDDTGSITTHYIFVDNDSTNAVVATNQTITFTSSSQSDTWTNYSSTTPSENTDDYRDDRYWPMAGERYGLDPQHAQANGSFFIDCDSGKIHFSSNMSGKTIVLDYISDSLGTDEEMLVPKLGEEAIYKWIAYGCLSARANVPQHVLARFKREKFAETRKAKIRISNIKIEEITQILRGKSKHIKH